jgi:hypothetical protein
MAGINKEFLISEIAGVCRQSWPTKDWGYDTEDQALPIPEIPETDIEVINRYFDSVRWEDEDEGEGDFDPQAFSYCDWENIAIDLAAIPGDKIDLSVDPPLTFTVTRSAEGHAQSSGTLFPRCGEVGDALESFVVALTAAGVPVWHSCFKEALQTVSDALVNNLDDEDPEEMEREMAANDLTLILEPDVAEGEANWILSGPSNAVTPLLDRLPAYSWVTRTEALRAVYTAITQSSDVS